MIRRGLSFRVSRPGGLRFRDTEGSEFSCFEARGSEVS